MLHTAQWFLSEDQSGSTEKLYWLNGSCLSRFFHLGSRPWPHKMKSNRSIPGTFSTPFQAGPHLERQFRSDFLSSSTIPTKACKRQSVPAFAIQSVSWQVRIERKHSKAKILGTLFQTRAHREQWFHQKTRQVRPQRCRRCDGYTRRTQTSQILAFSILSTAFSSSRSPVRQRSN